LVIIDLILIIKIDNNIVMKLFKKRIEEIIEKFDNRKIILYSTSANYFGQESKGYTQIRGNGVLILLNEKIYFEMWKPRKILEIPINKILKITSPRSHLKKSKFKPLLKIHFQNNQNKNDSAAWLIRNLDKWVKNIQILINSSNYKN